MVEGDVIWIVDEDVFLKIIGCDDGKSGGSSSDHITLEITRRVGDHAGQKIKMHRDWNGDLTFNDEYVELDSSFPQFLGLLDELAELVDYEPWNRIGETYALSAEYWHEHHGGELYER